MKPHDILMIQSADPYAYGRILRLSSICNRSYCHRLELGYEAYIGIMRGVHPWHSSHNRIGQLHALMSSGYRGWVLHLDADAYVYDHGFDIREYLAPLQAKPFVFTPGACKGRWDVNSGIFFINLSHPAARELIELWWRAWMAITDEQFRAAEDWGDIPHDQDLLQSILRSHPALTEQMVVESHDSFGRPNSSRMRQILRSFGGSLDSRCAIVLSDTQETLARYPILDRGLLEELSMRALPPDGMVAAESTAAAFVRNRELSNALAQRTAQLEASQIEVIQLGARLHELLQSHGTVASLFRAGEMLRRAARLELAARPAARSTDDLIRALYLGILDREPDSMGAAHYRNSLEGGLELQAVIRSMIASNEFKQLHSSP